MIASMKLNRGDSVIYPHSHPQQELHYVGSDDGDHSGKKLRRKEEIIIPHSPEGSIPRRLDRSTDVSLDQTSRDRISHYHTMILDAEKRLEAKKLLMPDVETIIDEFRLKLQDPWYAKHAMEIDLRVLFII